MFEDCPKNCCALFKFQSLSANTFELFEIVSVVLAGSEDVSKTVDAVVNLQTLNI